MVLSRKKFLDTVAHLKYGDRLEIRNDAADGTTTSGLFYFSGERRGNWLDVYNNKREGQPKGPLSEGEQIPIPRERVRNIKKLVEFSPSGDVEMVDINGEIASSLVARRRMEAMR